MLRGGPVEHPRYSGRRVFGAGLNLTRLYHGSCPSCSSSRATSASSTRSSAGSRDPEVEKLWVAAAETYAIGGACQLLHVVDHVIAARGCRLYLPARKEGIIPGASNLRLPRFVGDRLARQAILSGLEFEAGTPAGELLCDEVVEPRRVDAALVGPHRRADRARAWSTPRPTGARCASARSRSTSSATTWRPSRVSRRTAISARRSCATWRSTGRRMSATSERAVWDAVETLPRPAPARAPARAPAGDGRARARGPAAGDGPAARGGCDRARRRRLAR